MGITNRFLQLEKLIIKKLILMTQICIIERIKQTRNKEMKELQIPKDIKISKKEAKVIKKAFDKTMRQYRTVFIRLQNS
jgi:hypothetical protein